MTTSQANRVAWGLAAVTLVLLVSGMALDVVGESTGKAGRSVVPTVLALVFVAVGIMIASRQPGNPIGWIFLGVAVAQGFGSLAGGYAEYWLHGHRASEALGKTAAVYATSSWIPWVLVPTTFLLLLFPDGRLPSRRWRVVAWCAAVGIAGVFVLTASTPGRLEDFPQVVNPFGVNSTVRDLLAPVVVAAVLIGIAGSPLSLIVRFRRARLQQRQQIKWLAWAGALAAVTLVAATAAYDLVGAGAANATIETSLLGLPLAAGIAILRYHLYDIDVVINRTLVYGALTATLAATYLGMVLLLQLALGPLTADNGLAIAGSTLAVAALFQPARRQIQALVDRRFFRRKYDAARTLESFGGRLRDEVDLDALGGELRGVVAETMQPAHVSLWLRGAGR